MKKSLLATFIKTIEDINSEEKIQTDLCCRTFLKCDSHKRTELNETMEWHIQPCQCIDSFKMCLKNLNTSLSNQLESIHSINTTKCYSIEYPIIKCAKMETVHLDSKSVQLLGTFDHEPFLSRCIKFDLDDSKSKKLQILDVPFNDNSTMSAIIANFGMSSLCFVIFFLFP